MIKTLMSVIFPLVTIKYTTNILQADYIGKINFSNSIVGYFSLIAALGINSYATREGSRIRDEREKFQQFASEIFTLNLITSILSYVMLFATVFVFDKLHSYTVLITILSSIIILTTIGVNWINIIYEDYLYITIRSIIAQILSLGLLFALVKTKEDFYWYALISVFSNVGVNFANYYYVKRYCRLYLTWDKKIFIHFKPMFIIFASSLTISIFVNSGTTMIGIFLNDFAVGVYTVSVKVYTTIKLLITSALTVVLPRFSYYLGTHRKHEYCQTFFKVIIALLVLSCPIIVGLNIFAEDAILMLSDEKFLSGVLPLRILTIGILFSIFANTLMNAYLLPNKKENVVFRATLISAFINILLNLVLIPKVGISGAAVSAVAAEVVILFAEVFDMKTIIKKYYISYKRRIIVSVAKIFVACGLMCVFVLFLSSTINHLELRVITSISAGSATYFIALIFMRESTTISFINGVLAKLWSSKNIKQGG